MFPLGIGRLQYASSPFINKGYKDYINNECILSSGSTTDWWSITRLCVHLSDMVLQKNIFHKLKRTKTKCQRTGRI